MLRLLFAAALLPLAACDKSRDEGTSITVSGNNAMAAVDGATGGVKIDVPGFKGEIALPKIKLDADSFDLNGVHLYPGSTIERIDVRGGKSDGEGVSVAFTSPAAPATVRDWFKGRLEAADFTLRAEGNALVGQDDDKKPFRMDLAPKGERTAGTIVIG